VCMCKGAPLIDRSVILLFDTTTTVLQFYCLNMPEAYHFAALVNNLISSGKITDYFIISTVFCGLPIVDWLHYKRTGDTASLDVTRYALADTCYCDAMRPP